MCSGGECLGGEDNIYCELLTLSFPEEFNVASDNLEQPFILPITLNNPLEIGIEGLQFTIEYDSDIIDLDSVSFSESFGFDSYQLIQNSLSSSLSVSMYFTGEEEDLFSGNDTTILSLHGLPIIPQDSTAISFSSIQNY